MSRLSSTYILINRNVTLCDAVSAVTFTGKEKDSESGYHYFGARYYDSEVLTGWLSIDPMADKYPNISPYAHCAWTRPTGGDEHRWIKYNIVNNPVKLVDPDGMDFEKIIDHENKKIIIRAQFICSDASENQQPSLQRAVNSWNLCSFIVSFPGEDGTMEDYTVSFDINNGHGPTNQVSFIPEKIYDRIYNSYPESGGISDGHGISIRGFANNQILTHEMGHCFGLSDTELSKDCLMFASNTGNVRIKMLSSEEQLQLLSACGFSIKERGGRTELCIDTKIIGESPEGFWNDCLTSKNLSKNNTKHFVK